MVLLTLAFLPVFASVAGGELGAAEAVYGHPFHALAAILFLVAAVYHLQLGVQVVVEDYVHHGGWKAALLACNTLGCILLGAAGAFAVLLLALRAS